MKKRDRRLTPTSSALAAGWSKAVSRKITELKADTTSAFHLVGEGSSGDKDRSEMYTKL